MCKIRIPITVSGKSSFRNTNPTIISKMKSVIVFALFVAAAVAVPIDSRDATITEEHFDNIGVGDYSYGYKTSDGKDVSVEAHLKNNGPENPILEVRGSYSYPGPDGVVYTITYVGDENGYRADGAHIPRS